MPPETNNARRFSCEKGCSTHLDGFAPRPGSGWTEEHIQSIACTRSVLSDPLLDKILALMGVQLVNDSFVQQLKHVRDLDFINRLGMPPWLSSPGQRGLRLAVPEGKFVLIPWHPRVAALNRLLVLAICFPGFAPGQETTPTAVVFDNLTTSEATHWYESCDRAVQQAVSVVMRSYGFEWSSNRKHKVRRVTWQQIQGDADDASLPQLGVIHAVQMILTSHGKHLMNASKACPWPRVTPRRVREAVLCFMGNHYGSVPPSTPTPGRDAKDRYPIGQFSSPPMEPRPTTSYTVASEPSPSRPAKVKRSANGSGGPGASDGKDEMSVIEVRPQPVTPKANTGTRAGDADGASHSARQLQPLENDRSKQPKGAPRTAPENNGTTSESGSNIRSMSVDLSLGTPSPTDPNDSPNSLTDKSNSTPPTTPSDAADTASEAPATGRRVRGSNPLRKGPSSAKPLKGTRASRFPKIHFAMLTPGRKRAVVEDSGDDSDSDAPLTRRRRLDDGGGGGDRGGRRSHHRRDDSPNELPGPSITDRLDRVLTDAVAMGGTIEALREKQKSVEMSLRGVLEKMKKHLELNGFSCGGSLVNPEFMDLERERETSAATLQRAAEDTKGAEVEQESVKLLCREFLKKCG